MSSKLSVDRIRSLIEAVTELRDRCLRVEASLKDDLDRVAPAYRASARNLVHYLSLRQVDIRSLQEELSAIGLSSLGRLEAHTLDTLQSVLGLLQMLGRERPSGNGLEVPVDSRTGPLLLRDHARNLLGPLPGERGVRIMVTMPSEAATEPALVEGLLRAGMDLMRINCAHDRPEDWLAMVDNLRRARSVLQRPCRILADLAGPKLRTGALPSRAELLRLKVKRGGGEPVRLRLVAAPSSGDGELAPDPAALPVSADLLRQAQPGDSLRFKDRRGKRRRLRLIDDGADGLIAELRRSAWIGAEDRCRLFRGEERIGEGRFGVFVDPDPYLTLRVGDLLQLTRDDAAGQDVGLDDQGEPVPSGSPRVARIPCSLPAVFDSARIGDPVWLDDGRIGATVAANDGRVLDLRITHARSGSAKLRPEKGINFPDTPFEVPALTDKDRADLRALAPHVDLFGMSFVRTPEDVTALHEALDEVQAGHLGIVLKIENRLAFKRLPRLLLAGLRSPPVGVMVARGDLAVEVGFERLAEVQEEILWMCEAAHVPVIWATQVLEDLAKKGAPSRAEVTDAAMSARAECVMLNKGPYVTEAVGFLSDVLERMATHQDKKTARLRKLSVSELHV